MAEKGEMKTTRTSVYTWGRLDVMLGIIPNVSVVNLLQRIHYTILVADVMGINAVPSLLNIVSKMIWTSNYSSFF